MKGDKAFIVIVIIFGMTILASFILKYLGISNAVFDINFGISDGVIIGAILIGFLLLKFNEREKK